MNTLPKRSPVRNNRRYNSNLEDKDRGEESHEQNWCIGNVIRNAGEPGPGRGLLHAYPTGNPPTEEQLKELKDRYEAIVGGVFPLRANTDSQVAALQETLDRLNPDKGLQFVCYQGLKHARPFIEDGVAKMAEDGITEAVGIVLAPIIP